MKIYFGCSTNNLLENKEAYLETLGTVKSLGHVITRDWVPISVQVKKEKRKDISSENFYDLVISAIMAADAVIFDCSVNDHSVGYQLMFAVDHKKPVLMLVNSNYKKAENIFFAGIKSPLLFIKNYNDINEIQEIVKEFLVINSSKTKVRFNLVLDKYLNDYIEWSKFKYRQNKTEIIKRGIDKLISEDKLYQKHLKVQK